MSEDATIKQMEGSRIAEKAALFGLSAFFSKVLGLLRDLTIAQTVPLEVSDAWVLAFRIPHFLRRLFSEGFANAFFWGQKQTWGTFLAWSSLWTLLIAGFSGFLYVIPSNIFGERMIPGLTAQLYAGMFLYIWSLGITAYLLALAHQKGRLLSASLVPVLFNLVVLLALIFSHNLLFRLSTSLSWAGVLQILALLPQLKGLEKGPFLSAQFVSRITYFLQVGFAFCYLQYLGLLTVLHLRSGSAGELSFFFWAERLLEFPLALISTSFGLAGVSVLAKRSSERKKYFFHSLKWLLPAVVGLLLARREVVFFLFGAQQFNETDFQKFVDLLVPLSFLLLMMGIYKMILWVQVAQKRMLSLRSLVGHYGLALLVLSSASLWLNLQLNQMVQVFIILTTVLVLHSLLALEAPREVLLEVRHSLSVSLIAAVFMGGFIFGAQQFELAPSRVNTGIFLLVSAGFYLGFFEAFKRMIPERGTLG